MEDKLYLIGEFAAMNKVSSRMLRHYDKINLLKPISIKDNGYRHYSEQQIAVISKIKMLRDCDFTLDEIAQTLKNDSDTFLMEQVNCKIIELDAHTRLHQKAIALLKGIGEVNHQNDFVNQYGISLIERAKSTLIVSNQEFDWEQIENEFDKLFTFIDKKHLNINGCAVLLSHFDENDESKKQVGVSVTKPFQDEQYSTIIVPKSKCISTIHYGDYYNIGYAYSSLMKYADMNGYLIEHCFSERYFIDRSHTTNPNQYVTEISVCIKNKP